MCVRYSHFGTSQSQRRARPRNYIREMTQILKAFRQQTFQGPACTPGSNTSQWDGRDRVSRRGYIGKQMDCASAQIFSAFRPQTFYGPACTPGSTPSRTESGAARGRRIDPLTYSFPNWNKNRFVGTAKIFGERRSARPSK